MLRNHLDVRKKRTNFPELGGRGGSWWFGQCSKENLLLLRMASHPMYILLRCVICSWYVLSIFINFPLSDYVMCYSCSQSDSIGAILGRGQKWQNDNLLLQPAPAPLTLIIRLGLGHHPKFHFIIEFLPWLTMSNIFPLEIQTQLRKGSNSSEMDQKRYFFSGSFPRMNENILKPNPKTLNQALSHIRYFTRFWRRRRS